mmetsp:Transcript_19976/g.47579  ORF Transcript_19976/g.47579 Transcript_19976/m.47579 type:complete len:305 (-) Transcript_19976:79-993(-)
MAAEACAVEVFDPFYLLISALITVGQQLAFFIVAACFKFDKVTDFAGGTNFVLLAILTLVLGGTYYLRQMLVSFAIVFWGVRLSAYLLIRILKTGKDERFDSMDRGFSLSFAAFWVGQAVWVFVVSLPVILVNSSCDHNPTVGVTELIGLFLFGAGLLLEAVADQQKFEFRERDENKGKFCNVGTWAWSRHPNYAGEILLWWGIFIACTPVFRPWMWVAILSPLLVSLLILFVSGLPILEKSANKRYGGSSEYKEYREQTSILLPLPPGVYGALPEAVKLVLFLEWPLYARDGSDDQGPYSAVQ